jgi:serine/threonine protein kinase
MEGVDHPKAQELRRFCDGLLPAEDAAAVEEHLTFCDDCCWLVEAAPEDSFVGRLREAQDLQTAITPFYAAGGSPRPEDLDALVEHPRYRIIRPLARGGMGAVYLAEHRRMGRSVALKVIHPEYLNHPGALLRFQQEVQAAAKLDHPNIVAAYDADQAGDAHFLVMEHVEGQNLADCLAATGPLPVAEACRIVREAALGLQHAHERGMVHRDIKPQNLMLTPSGQVKVLDFGLALLKDGSGRLLNADPSLRDAPLNRSGSIRLTGAGTVMGTADYIAPEQARDPHGADCRADIYSLGCTLYHLLAGRPPFPNGTAREKLQLQMLDTPQQLRQLRSEIPERLARIVATMMAKNPANRLQTAEAVAIALQPFTPTIGRRRKPRQPWSAVALSLLFAGMLAGASFAYCIRTEAWNDIPEQPAQLPAQLGPAKGGEVRRFEGHLDYVTFVAFTPDGRQALSSSAHWYGGNGDYSVRLWDLQTGAEVRKFEGGGTGFFCLAVSADNQHVFAGGYDGAVWMWQRETGELIRKFSGHRRVITGLAVTPDGKQLLAAADLQVDVRVWDVATGQETGRLSGTRVGCPRLVLTPDGRRVAASGSEGIVRIWDLATQTEVSRLVGHRGDILALVFSHDGKRAITSSFDETLRYWDVEAGTEIHHIPTPGAQINTIAFTPQERQILVAGGTGDRKDRDYTLRLLDVETGAEVFRFPGHRLLVTRVVVSADGRSVLSGSWDTTVRLWQLPDPVPSKLPSKSEPGP